MITSDEVVMWMLCFGGVLLLVFGILEWNTGKDYVMGDGSASVVAGISFLMFSAHQSRIARLEEKLERGEIV